MRCLFAKEENVVVVLCHEVSDEVRYSARLFNSIVMLIFNLSLSNLVDSFWASMCSRNFEVIFEGVQRKGGGTAASFR